MLGIPLIQVFVILLLLTIFMFSVLAHALFDHVANDDETVSFKTMKVKYLIVKQCGLISVGRRILGSLCSKSSLAKVRPLLDTFSRNS